MSYCLVLFVLSYFFMGADESDSNLGFDSGMTSSLPGDDVYPAGDVEHEKLTRVSGALLSKCPRPLRRDLKMAVLLLRGRNAAAEVMEKAGCRFVDKDGSSCSPDDCNVLDRSVRLVFDEKLRLPCPRMDNLVEDLRGGDQLGPTLEKLIADLRMQFGALAHYFFRLALLKKGEVGKGFEVIDEMRNCGKYPVRIFSNITLMRMLMDKALNFDEAEQVYQYMANDRYMDFADDREKSVCKPDIKFFKLWAGVCVEPLHFKALYEVMKNHIPPASKSYRFLVYMWRRSCETFEDFREFGDRVIRDGLIDPDYPFFMMWLGKVGSLKQMLVVIEYLFKFRLVPDMNLVNKFYRVVNCYRGEGVDSVSVFMSELRNIYSDGVNSDLASSDMFRRLFGMLRSNLTGSR